jgi:hypothetical protein
LYEISRRAPFCGFGINEILYFIIVIQQNIFDRRRVVLGILRQRLVSINLFKSRALSTDESVYRGRVATRVFIVVLIICVIGFGFYTFLSSTTQVVTIMQLSLVTYEKLFNEQSVTLQCPCSKLSIPYGAFLNVTFVLHQVCSSNFISPEWLNYLTLFDPTLADMNVNS